MLQKGPLPRILWRNKYPSRPLLSVSNQDLAPNGLCTSGIINTFVIKKAIADVYGFFHYKISMLLYGNSSDIRIYQISE